MVKKSRAAIMEETLKPLAFEEISVPYLQEGEILVRNTFTTLCKSDINTFIGKRQEKTPTILGHEIVGKIVESSPNAPKFDEMGKSLSVGDRITWGIYASDPKDPLSKQGIPQKAADLFKYGHEQHSNVNTLHGGLAEYTILRKNTPIVSLPETIDDPLAAIINCSVATVAGAFRLAEDIKGKRVLIIGTGMLGIVACAMASLKGVQQVIGLDINEARLEKAMSFGATHVYNAQSEWDQMLKGDSARDFPVDLVFDFSGVPEALERSLNLLGIGGKAIWVGGTFPQRDMTINAEQIIRRLITIKGLHNYNNKDLVSAVEFIDKAQHHFPFKDLIYTQGNLDKVNEAFQTAINDQPFRVGLVC